MPRIREHLLQTTNRHGNIRYMFHRLPDGRRITIKGEPGDAAFEARYDFLVSGGDRIEELDQASINRQREGERPELVRELTRLHERHLDRLVTQGALSSSTSAHYARFTRRFADEFGDVPLHTITDAHLIQVLDMWSETANAYNNALRSLKHLFAYAASRWGLRPSPAALIAKKEVATDGFAPWSEDDLKRYFKHHKLGTKAHLTMMLLMRVAPRISDLVKLGPKNIVEIGGVRYLHFKPQKTKSVAVTVPMTADLLEAIDATETGKETFLVTTHGKPHSAKAFCSNIAQWRREAGITEQLSAHGMRKTVGINLAENGATEYQLMAALGHTTPKVTEVYTRAAKRRDLAIAAVAKSTLRDFSKSGEEQ
ncbi:Site-specific recombinase XerD [Yoonia litorea]|uniref:Site-specific recombinase XerD n=2 Tax=Yoonia litorea TaxID=1123755 RepID=A0A1I6MWV1_9RHOB|nr:Site-specific recombinase XerD [Yoonia litorea]